MLEIDAITEACRMAREDGITTSVTHCGHGPDDYSINLMPVRPHVGIVVAAFDAKGRPMQFWGFSEFAQSSSIHW